MHYGESNLRYPKTYNGVIFSFNVKVENHNSNTFAQAIYFAIEKHVLCSNLTA